MNRNYHQHIYPDLHPTLSVTGYVIAVHDANTKIPTSMIGPIPTIDQAEMLISFLYDMEDKEYHLWPMAAPKELLDGK